jgi:hypothetical protein
MKTYAISFLLFLQQVSLGGLFALAVTPFRQLERGFYKSTAGVLLLTAFLALWGKVDLYMKEQPSAAGFGAALDLWIYILYCGFMVLYLISLWGERVWIRARAFSVALLLGILGLGFTAFNFHNAVFWSVETFLYPVSFILSSLLLGSATVGMLIGHWYLIDTGQSLDPFWGVFRFFVVILVVHTSFLILAPGVLYFLGDPATHAGLNRLWSEHLLLLGTRLLVSQAGPLVLCYMIWQTLKIPNTMAATGLFYIALLGVVVGEILGRQILSLTALPL